jgi:hypothetical protein
MKEVNVSNSATMWSNVSSVFVNDVLEPRLRCMSCESTCGPVPGQAILQVGSVTQTEKAPRTLLATKDYQRWKYGSRVKICSDGDTLWLGTMMKRNDNMATDQPLFTALDDRWLLSRIKVQPGCFVYDDINGEGSLKYVSRYLPVANPKGQWNCIGMQTADGVIPVFAPYSQYRYTNASDAVNGQYKELADKQLSCWTPRRLMMYLWYAYFKASGVAGMGPDFRTLLNSTRIQWETGDIGDGTSTATSGAAGLLDPLDSKIAETSLTDCSLLEAMCRVLRQAGTHDLSLQVGQTSDGKDVSKVTFTKLWNIDKGGLDLLIRRGGAVAESNVIVDFDLAIDATNTAESFSYNGNEVKVEAELKYELEESTDWFTASWTAEDLRKFQKVIWGGDYNDDPESYGTYALMPSTLGGEPDTPCNGSLGGEGRPLVYSRTMEAVAIARQNYPNVFSEYRILMSNIEAAGANNPFNGPNGEFSDRNLYPIINFIRSIFPEQLSKVTLFGDVVQQRLPIRIQVKRGGEWLDAPYLNGFMSGPLSFKIAGLAENANLEPWCNYEGDLIYDPWNVTARGMKINCTLPLDVRVKGYAETTKDDISELDPTLATELGGKVMDAEFNPAYIREYRINSWAQPMAVKYADGDIEDNTDDALRTATRILSRRKRPEKRSSFVFRGIRREYFAGVWLNSIKILDGAANDQVFTIQAPIKTVTYDFVTQETKVGGLLFYSAIPLSQSETGWQAVDAAVSAQDTKGVVDTPPKISSPAPAPEPMMYA